MFSIYSTIQCSRVQVCQAHGCSTRYIFDNCLFLLDLGIIALVICTALGVIKNIPKDFLTKERMIAFKATAIAIGALDLIALSARNSYRLLCFSPLIPSIPAGTFEQGEKARLLKLHEEREKALLSAMTKINQENTTLNENAVAEQTKAQIATYRIFFNSYLPSGPAEISASALQHEDEAFHQALGQATTASFEKYKEMHKSSAETNSAYTIDFLNSIDSIKAIANHLRDPAQSYNPFFRFIP